MDLSGGFIIPISSTLFTTVSGQTIITVDAQEPHSHLSNVAGSRRSFQFYGLLSISRNRLQTVWMLWALRENKKNFLNQIGGLQLISRLYRRINCETNFLTHSCVNPLHLQVEQEIREATNRIKKYKRFKKGHSCMHLAGGLVMKTLQINAIGRTQIVVFYFWLHSQAFVPEDLITKLISMQKGISGIMLIKKCRTQFFYNLLIL